MDLADIVTGRKKVQDLIGMKSTVITKIISLLERKTNFINFINNFIIN